MAHDIFDTSATHASLVCGITYRLLDTKWQLKSLVVMMMFPKEQSEHSTVSNKVQSPGHFLPKELSHQDTLFSKELSYQGTVSERV